MKDYIDELTFKEEVKMAWLKTAMVFMHVFNIFWTAFGFVITIPIWSLDMIENKIPDRPKLDNFLFWPLSVIRNCQTKRNMIRFKFDEYEAASYNLHKMIDCLDEFDNWLEDKRKKYG